MTTQDDLTKVFEQLQAGRQVDGWGMSRHRDYDMLVNREKRLFKRFRDTGVWQEVTGDEDSPAGARH